MLNVVLGVPPPLLLDELRRSSSSSLHWNYERSCGV
jgi:hypothetical protein